MIAENFGYALPRRCLRLLDEMSGQVPRADGGPLSTTFLLTIAMPLLVFPHQVLYGDGRLVFGDVNQIDASVKDVLAQPFGAAPFRDDPAGGRWAWSFSSLSTRPSHPDALRGGEPGLMTPEGVAAADALGAEIVVGRLRHALSHAGVVYLDAEGRYRPAAHARMLAFVSEYGAKNNRKYSVLAVSEEGFRVFLRAWAGWLSSHGFDQVANAA